MIQVFLDLDGTLVHTDKTVSGYSLKILNELHRKGKCRFHISSGRALSSILPFLEETGLADCIDMIIANNGAQIYDLKKAKIVFSIPIPEDTVCQMIERLNALNHCASFFNGAVLFTTAPDDPVIPGIMQRNHSIRTADPQAEKFEPPYRVMTYLDPGCPDEDARIIRRLEFKGLKSFRSEKYIVDWVQDSVSKGAAMEEIRKRYPEDEQETWAFGDSENDIPILAASDRGICMLNGLPRVKAITHVITPLTNDQDGVAHYLEAELLK